MGVTQTQQPNVPALRFPEFGGDWTLSKLSKHIRSLDAGVSVNSGERPANQVEYGVLKTSAVTRGVFELSENKVVVEDNEIRRLKEPVQAGTIIVSRMNTPTLVGANAYIDEAQPNLFLPDRLWAAKLNTKSSARFVAYILGSGKGRAALSSRATGTSGSMKNITKPDVLTLNIFVPTLPEQQKIASFLSSVDRKIEQLAKKKSLLEQYKKGMMQKLFNQELRFKDDQGNDFADWEKKELVDILDYQQPTQYLVENAEYSNSFTTPVLTAGKTFLLGYTDETTGVFEENLPTIIFDDFTTAFKYVDFPFKAKSSAMKMLIPKTNGVNLRFVHAAMMQIRFPLGEHKRYWISEYQWEKIGYPSPPEQQKITDFLSAIDRKIDLVSTELDHARTFKKGLLQQMFV